MTRHLKPRAAVAVYPSFVSQLNCLALLGVDERRYLGVLVPACRPDVVHVGKLRLVELSRAVEALRALAAHDVESQAAEEDGEVPSTVDAVLSAVGMERAH